MKKEETYPIVVTKDFNRPYFLSGYQHFFVYKLDGSVQGERAGLHIPPITYLRRLKFEVEIGKQKYNLHECIKKTEIFMTYTIHHYEIKNMKIKLTFFAPEFFEGILINIEVTKPKKNAHLIINPKFSFNYIWHSVEIDATKQTSKFKETEEEHATHESKRRYKILYYPHHIRAKNEFDPHMFCYIYSDKKIVKKNKIPLKNARIYLTGTSRNKANLKMLTTEFLKHIPKYRKEKEKRYKDSILDRTIFKCSDKELEKAFMYAKTNIRMLRHYQPNLGGGWCTSIPYFMEFFGRDTFMSVPALLQMGDFPHVKSALNAFTRYQSRFKTETRSIGEIPHEIWLNGEANYYSADSTLLYIKSLYDYYLWTNDSKFIRAIKSNIEKAVKYMLSKVRKSYFTHKPQGFLSGITWMDSVNRSSTGVEIQAMYIKALEASTKLLKICKGDKDLLKKVKKQIKPAKTKLDNFWIPEIKYYADHKKRTNLFIKKITSNPVIVMGLGLVPTKRAVKMFDTLKEKELLTPYGIRTLSKKDSKYHPEKYHSGSIWPMNNGWLALAAFKYNQIDLGYDILKTFPRLYNIEIPGMIPEYIDGDTFKVHNPTHFNSWCQLWSSTLFIHAIMEGLLGITIKSPNQIKVKPKIPKEIKKIKITNLRVGGGAIDIDYNNGKLKTKVRSGNIKITQ